ncbi:MAG: DUF6268 family outer membrane beta-barrel protein [Kiritimatiellae bacterium]|nr:DUF6268 family outer membrane beta-barrel protein [Kiritimatiellia bacterium]
MPGLRQTGPHLLCAALISFSLPVISPAQNTNGIIIDQDAGQTLELKAIETLARPVKPRVHGALTIGAGTDLENTLKDGGGYAKATRESLLLGLDVPFGTNTALSGSFEREFSQYNLDLNPSSISEIGSMHLAVTRFGLIARRRLDERWSLFAVGDITFSTENRAAWNDGMTYGGLMAVRRQVNKSFAWQLGVIARTHLEDKALFLPIPGIDWQINDRLTLRTAQGLTFSYDCMGNKRWLFDVGGNFENRIYRMNGRSQLPDGLFIDRSIPILTALTRRFGRIAFVKISVATPVYRRYKFCGSDGATLETLDSNFFPCFSFSAGAAF